MQLCMIYDEIEYPMFGSPFLQFSKFISMLVAKRTCTNINEACMPMYAPLHYRPRRVQRVSHFPGDVAIACPVLIYLDKA